MSYLFELKSNQRFGHMYITNFRGRNIGVNEVDYENNKYNEYEKKNISIET